MSKGRSAFRLHTASGQDIPKSVSDTMSALIREAHRQNSKETNERAASARLARPSHFAGGGSPMLPEALRGLLRETEPTRRISDLVLPRGIVGDLQDLVSEIRETALLRSHSLEPRHKVLLIGPPGTGKTSLASALAFELALPFLTVRYEGLVGSYLGETASRLQEIVEYVSHTPCVLFFDEFDSVGKERSDAQETGEIKRVVSSLLLNMDSMPSHCVVVCATNHPEMLDRAVWRRFELRIELPPPGEAELRDWFERTEKSFGHIGMSADEFVRLFSGETFSEIEAVTVDARRKVVLSRGQVAPSDAFRGAVERWQRRRNVGGFAADGSTSDRTNPARARSTRKKKGTATALPQGDLLGRPGEETQS
ncbi:AAA family ATPase [Bradyrhizobium sp. BTAi1]|uniref:AAA family ATPase n=1 Tax=Bradyrhizobium sp. (strain BTAi1 / ATCC BAA-1182) TaxID=288000 RepID=UPI00005DEB9A|nr:ATP-binding protein [Bradyrhizobium sp. BTAi1]ABQ35227.1 putative ATPase [Bradyrhizobium sp. BTAi1]